MSVWICYVVTSARDEAADVSFVGAFGEELGAYKALYETLKDEGKLMHKDSIEEDDKTMCYAHESTIRLSTSLREVETAFETLLELTSDSWYQDSRGWVYELSLEPIR